MGWIAWAQPIYVCHCNPRYKNTKRTYTMKIDTIIATPSIPTSLSTSNGSNEIIIGRAIMELFKCNLQLEDENAWKIRNTINCRYIHLHIFLIFFSIKSFYIENDKSSRKFSTFFSNQLVMWFIVEKFLTKLIYSIIFACRQVTWKGAL